MKIKQAIIVAGGRGTRLADTVPDLPKCLAPVAGRPFLFYVINYLRLQGIEEFIFSLGYKHEMIEAYLADQFSRLQYQCVIEKEPLDTGGAIRLAIERSTDPHVAVANGDTLFKIDLQNLFSVHLDTAADCTIALKPMQDGGRYGNVTLKEDYRIAGFEEKKERRNGLINGGVYILSRQAFIDEMPLNKFSFESDYLARHTATSKLSGLEQPGYFIDIGIPSAYQQAQKDLQHPPLDLSIVDKNWTLFLDRDGVINIDKVGSYIFNAAEFIFENGSPGIFKKLTERFKYIIVTTNQRGVARKLMTKDDLDGIHQKMLAEIQAAGGHIAAVFACTAINNEHPCRKPNPGMITAALRQFPGIDLSRAIMVGNNFSDMQFGKNAGIYTVFVKTTIDNVQLPHPDIDLVFDSLADFAKALDEA